MTTENQQVTAESVLSATVRYSNRDDASRSYDITANVNIQNGTVSSFERGEVRKLPEAGAPGPQVMNNVATFSSYNPKSLGLNANDAEPEEAMAVMTSVYAFMAAVRSTVSVTPLNV